MKKITIIALIVGVVGIGGLLIYKSDNTTPYNNNPITDSSLPEPMHIENIMVTSKDDIRSIDFIIENNYGEELEKLSNLSGKIVVVNSWAVWCPFCKKELEDFAVLQEEFGEDLIIIAVNRAESHKKTFGFTESIGITEKIMFLQDADDSFYKSIGGFSMPETIFIDKDGNIAIHKRGSMDIGEIRDKINQLLQV